MQHAFFILLVLCQNILREDMCMYEFLLYFIYSVCMYLFFMPQHSTKFKGSVVISYDSEYRDILWVSVVSKHQFHKTIRTTYLYIFFISQSCVGCCGDG